MGGGRTEKQALESAWAVGTCDRCGSLLVLGEHVARIGAKRHTESLCWECAAQPGLIAAGSPLMAVEIEFSEADEELLAA